MTKKQLATLVENLVNKVAERHGATMTTKSQVVGGKTVDVSVAEGGLFNLEAARGILAAAITKKTDELVNFMGS